MDASEYATTARYLMAAKMYSLASCVMLFYDMLITLGDEIEKIWMQPFSNVTALWFLNRYITPLGYIVIIVSFHDPNWGPEACERYVRFPEILKVFTATAVGVIFILRLYAVYGRSRPILISFIVFLVAEIAVKIWSFTGSSRLELPPGLVGCILTGNSGGAERVMYTWIAELVFDTTVFLAMLYRTLYLYRNMPVTSRGSSISQVLLRDGIIYFAVIFVSNLVTVLIYVMATPSLKVINASFSTLITTLMISRMMLNLRKTIFTPEDEIDQDDDVASAIRVRGFDSKAARGRDAYPMVILGSRRDAQTLRDELTTQGSIQIYKYTEQEIR